MRRRCLPGISDDAHYRVIDGSVVIRRLFLRRGEHLYWMGQETGQKLYAIRVGMFKLYQLSSGGIQRVASLPAAGDVVGLDAIGADRHRCGAVALTDGIVCEMSHPALAHADLDDAGMGGQLDRMLSRELARAQRHTLLIREGTARRKLAGFLLLLARCQGASGPLRLPMTRQDIGDYLGLMPETVSRVLHRFSRANVVSLQRSALCILDFEALRRIAGVMEPQPA